MSEINRLPWWTKGIENHKPAPRATLADWWDAFFGRLETFYRVELDGSWCIVEPHEVATFTEGPDRYTIECVEMTRRQFESLPEFEGF